MQEKPEVSVNPYTTCEARRAGSWPPGEQMCAWGAVAAGALLRPTSLCTRDASLPGLNLSKIDTLGRSDKWIANYTIILLCSSSKKCLVKN